MLQWCPDISHGPVQPDNETIRGVGYKTVLLPLSVIKKRYMCGENAVKVMIHYVL